MGTNESWPEAFGFSVDGESPVVIREVEEGGSAQQAGLQPGDAIIELDGVCVEEWSRLQVLDLARSASKVPPSLVVMSRVRQFSIPRDEEGCFGLTFRGNSPVFVRSVDYPSSARTAGVRSGDLLLEVNWENVRYCSKVEVLKSIQASKRVLHLMVVTGGLGTTPRSPLLSANIRSPVVGVAGGVANKKTTEAQTNKARIFHSKVNYYLMNDDQKKVHLLTLLRLYSKDRDVDSLGHSLDLLLDTPIQRRLLPHIRAFILSSHHKRFDVLVSYAPDHAPSGRRGSCDIGSPTRSLSMTRDDAPWRSSLPNLAAAGERVVRVARGGGGFGLTLSGNCPVFIRSVDPGGAASRAGLVPGDRILKLNGLDIRNSTHSHVVRLLRGSGTCPTLVVTSPASLGTVGSTVPIATIRQNSQALKDKMAQVLGAEERQSVFEKLGRFSHNQNLQDLVEGLGNVLTDSNKVVLFHYVCQLLPGEAQIEFDRIAAAMLSGDVPQSSNEGGARSLGIVQPGGQSHDLLHISHDMSEGELHDTAIGVRTTQSTVPSSIQGIVQPAKHKKESSIQEAVKKLSSNGVANISTISTPGGTPLPPNPPPTPQMGVGGIPIPPPPPPPGGPGQTAKLKRVNWEKLHGTEGTIWSELSVLEDTLEYFELEKQFASGKPREAMGKGKKKQPTILDPRKAYNISILLGHLKLPFEKIKEAVLRCDESVLSEQHLQQLEAFAPDKTECLGFTRYYDKSEVLNIADRFSCEMSTIPCYQERLKAMILKLHFRDKVAEIQPDLEAISLAAIQLKSSKHLKKVLEIVLAVGNYMNAGNHRVGGAAGFRVSYLAQLKDLRTTDNKSTLVHFVAGTAERKFPDSLEFPNDLSFVRKAARVSGQTLEVEMNELTQGLKDIRRDIREISSSQERMEDDHFEAVMNPFLVEADQQMEALLQLYTKMKQEYQTAARFFGEDSLKMRIDDFFGAFATFVDDFEKAVRENKTEREQAVLAERRLQERNNDDGTKKRGLSKLFSRSKEDNPDLRKELEAKSIKSLDITAFERRKDAESAEPEQHDFRYLLKQTDHSKQPPTQSGAWPISEPHQTSSSYHQPIPDQARDEDMSDTNGSQDYDHETQF